MAIKEAMAWHKNKTETSMLGDEGVKIAFNFGDFILSYHFYRIIFAGVIACLGGIVGVTIGSVIALVNQIIAAI